MREDKQIFICNVFVVLDLDAIIFLEVDMVRKLTVTEKAKAFDLMNLFLENEKPFLLVRIVV